MTVKCCKCDQIRMGGMWMPRRALKEERFSYTYCPHCHELCKREVWRERRAMRVQVGAGPLAV